MEMPETGKVFAGVVFRRLKKQHKQKDKYSAEVKLGNMSFWVEPEAPWMPVEGRAYEIQLTVISEPAQPKMRYLGLWQCRPSESELQRMMVEQQEKLSKRDFNTDERK